MHTAMIRYPFLHPGPQQQPSGTTGPYTIQFLPSAIIDGMDGFVAHVGVLQLVLQGDFTVPAGDIVGPDDWDMLLAINTGTGAIEGTGITLAARGEQPVQCGYQSVRRIIMSEAELAGISADITQTGPLLDNSQGMAPVTYNNIIVVYTIKFTDDRWTDPFKYLKAAQWWAQGNWTFNLAAPSAVFGAGFGWNGSAPTVMLGITLLMSPDIVDCAPFEWREKFNLSTGGATTYWDPGIYDVAGFYSPAFQGDGGFASDDLNQRVVTIFNPNYPFRFPNNVSPLQYALMAGTAGAPAGTPFALNLSSVALSTIRLFGPDWAGHRVSLVNDNQLVQDKQIAWTVNMVGGQTFTTQHQYYMARAKARAICSPSQPAGSTGVILQREVKDRLKNGCSNGFAQWIPLAPPGYAAPPPAMWPRSTMISRRR